MKIITIAKYIDQPAILSKLHAKMPAALCTVGAGVWGYETFCKQKDTKNKDHRAFKNAVTIGSTVAASLIGAKGLKIGGKKIFNGLMETMPLKEVLKNQAKAIDDYISKSKDKNSTLQHYFGKCEKQKIHPERNRNYFQKTSQNPRR